MEPAAGHVRRRERIALECTIRVPVRVRRTDDPANTALPALALRIWPGLPPSCHEHDESSCGREFRDSFRGP
jgi:hypothetical protein